MVYFRQALTRLSVLCDNLITGTISTLFWDKCQYNVTIQADFQTMQATQSKLNLSDIKDDYNGWTDWTTWNVALWINNDSCFNSIASECRTWEDFLFEMQFMIGSMATPDGADWGEADLTEMQELIDEIREGV